MRAIIAVAMSVVLCGCATKNGPTPAETDAKLRAGFEAAKVDCQARFPASPRHNHVAYANCLNDFSASVRSQLRYPDLSVLISTRRLELAEKVDSGALTEAEADAELAQTRAWAIGEEQRRDNGTMQTQAQMAAARAAYMRAFSPAPAVVVQPQCNVLIGGRCQ